MGQDGWGELLSDMGKHNTTSHNHTTEIKININDPTIQTRRPRTRLLKDRAITVVRTKDFTGASKRVLSFNNLNIPTRISAVVTLSMSLLLDLHLISSNGMVCEDFDRRPPQVCTDDIPRCRPGGGARE